MKIIVVNDEDFDNVRVQLNQIGIAYDAEEYVWDLAFKEYLRDKFPDLDEDKIEDMVNHLLDNTHLYEEIDEAVDLEYLMYMSEVR